VVRGRSSDLIRDRNEALVTRYLFMMDLTGWRLDLVNRLVAKDFFLEIRTVENIIEANYSLLKQIRQQKLNRKSVEEKYPQYSWEMPDKSFYE
jgi:hypothetical protein